MGLLQITAATLAVAGSVFAMPAAPNAAQAKYCDATTSLCYNEWKSSSNIIYRVAIPQATAAPFDIAIQIVAPKTAGWAGIAWGGSMTNNPITMAWPNGDTVMASARMAR
jgi:hypothetical protein